MGLIKQIAKFVLFWWLVFTLQRLIFSIHYNKLIFNDGVAEYLKLFYHSIRLDLAMIGFVALATLPFWLFYKLTKNKTQYIAWKILGAQQILLIVLIALIHCGEINVYGEWMHKLSVRVFNHLINPDEVFRSATFGNYIFFFIYLTIEVGVGIWLLRKIFPFKAHTIQSSWKHSLVIVPFCGFLGGLSFLSARGGWQPIPIGINSAMYSQNSVLNDISVNSTYFFIHSLWLYGKVDLDKYLAQTDVEEATKFVTEIMAYEKEHTNFFLTTTRPNIVVIVLESWAVDAISHTGLHDGTTPHFDQLIKEGVYFSKFYAAAGTSEIGNAAIFGGYPALPQVSLTLHPDKSRKLKSLNQTLKEEGYYASYLFGGDLKYGNIGGYFLDHQFDRVEDENDFDPSLKRGILNVYDHDLYHKFFQNINTSPKPFMQIAFTGSTHSPYDIPAKWKDFWDGEEAGIMNSIRYADHALHEFLMSCKAQPWYENTLFIMVADHGRTTPLNNNAIAEPYFRIPLLFWGPTIQEEYKGYTHNRIAMQSDIVATLLNQMQITSTDYPWSRDVMSPTYHEFAVYSSSLGYGWKDTEGNFFYYMNAERFVINEFEAHLHEIKLSNCRKFLKALWQEFKEL